MHRTTDSRKGPRRHYSGVKLFSPCCRWSGEALTCQDQDRDCLYHSVWQEFDCTCYIYLFIVLLWVCLANFWLVNRLLLACYHLLQKKILFFLTSFQWICQVIMSHLSFKLLQSSASFFFFSISGRTFPGRVLSRASCPLSFSTIGELKCSLPNQSYSAEICMVHSSEFCGPFKRFPMWAAGRQVFLMANNSFCALLTTSRYKKVSQNAEWETWD